MNNLAFVAEIHVCLPRDTWSLRGREEGGGGLSHIWMGYIVKYRLIGYGFWGSRAFNRVSFFYPVGLVSLFWSLDGVTQVVMDGLFHPFHFVGKKIVILKKNCKVLRVVYTYWRRIFYYPHGICFRGLHIEKIVLRWNEYSFCSYMGPNQVRIMDQMASPLSVRPQVRFIKTDTCEGIGQWLIGFCVYDMFLLWFDGLPLVTFFVYFQ